MNTLCKKWWRSYIFISFYFFTNGISISQSDFRQGYIIHKTGDTSYSLINYARSSICEVKSKDENQIFQPADIRGFGFINDRYYSSEILRDTFVEIIIDGFLSLVKLQEKYYLLKEGEPIRIILPTDKYENGFAKWQGILKYIVSDCNNLSAKVDRIHFSEHEISGIVIDYNKCKNKNWIEYKSKLSGLHISPGIGIGIATASLTLNGGEETRNFPYRFSMRDIFPSLTFNVSFPKYAKSISAQLELQLKKVKSSGEVISTSDKVAKYRETFLNASFVHVPILLKYSFQQNKNEFSILAGVFLDLFVHQDNKLIAEDFSLGSVITEYSETYYDFNNIQYGLAGGVNEAIHLSKFSINTSLRYNIQAFYINSRLSLNRSDVNFIRTPSLFNRFEVTIYIQKK